MYKILIPLCSLIAISASAQKLNDTRFDGLDALFQQTLKELHGAGFAVAVVEKNKVVYSKGFGYRNLEKKIPVTPNTLFAIGSCTKAFTSSLIGGLQQEGKVDLDKPVHNYLPELKFYNDAMNNTVTLRSMMSHSTGLPRHDFSWYFFTTSSRDSILQRVQYQEPTYGVREHWQYNNFMFAAQGWLVEKITGKTWENNIQKNIFDPLGMNRSNFSITNLQKADDASLGYGIKNDSIIKKLDYYEINSMGPAGSINSSVTEMANWVTTWINGGKFNGKEIIPASYVSEAISSQAIVAPQLPTKEKADIFFSNYGFGWFLLSYRGHYRVEHGGNINGFSASTCFFPTDSIGIIVLTNQDGSSIPGVIRNILADRILKLPYFDWLKDVKTNLAKAKAQQKIEKESGISSRKLNTKPSFALKGYEGNYNNSGYGTIVISSKNDSLFAGLGGKAMWLRHYHYDVFEPFFQDAKEGIDTTDSAPFKLQFKMGVNGEIESLTAPFEGGLKPLEFTKKPPVKELKIAELAKYVGNYDLSGTAIKVYVKDNLLYVFVPGQPEYELVPNGNDKFSLKVVQGFYVQFILNDKAETTALTFIQPNGNFVAKRK